MITPEQKRIIDAAASVEIERLIRENPGLRLVEQETLAMIFLAGMRAGSGAMFHVLDRLLDES